MSHLWLSPNYQGVPMSPTDTKVVAITWGFTLGFSLLTAVKAGNQTKKIWKRKRRITTYLTLVWLEIIDCTVLGFLCWFFIDGELKPGFITFFLLLFFWSLQLHFLLQILINRISVLMVNKQKALYLKWGVAIAVTLINISVFCIWIPARLQVSEAYMHLNDIWDRVEKVIFCLIDVGLNVTFMYLVHHNLIAAGFVKYKPLYNYNVAMVFISISMDILIIGMMSLNNPLVYTQFHPLAYIVKLNIELNMMGLISKVVKTGQIGPSYSGGDPSQSTDAHQNNQGRNRRRSTHGIPNNADGLTPGLDYYHAWVGGPDDPKRRNDQFPDPGSHELHYIDQIEGRNDVIIKTMESHVIRKSMDDFDAGGQSETSSTKVLKP